MGNRLKMTIAVVCMVINMGYLEAAYNRTVSSDGWLGRACEESHGCMVKKCHDGDNTGNHRDVARFASGNTTVTPSPGVREACRVQAPALPASDSGILEGGSLMCRLTMPDRVQAPVFHTGVSDCGIVAWKTVVLNRVQSPVTVSKFNYAMGGVFASVGLQGTGHRFDVMPSQESPHGQVSDKNNGVQLPVGFGSDYRRCRWVFSPDRLTVWVSAPSSTLENMDASALSSTVPTKFPSAQSPIFWTLLPGVLVPQLFPSLAQEFGSPSASESIELASPLINFNFCQATLSFALLNHAPLGHKGSRVPSAWPQTSTQIQALRTPTGLGHPETTSPLSHSVIDHVLHLFLLHFCKDFSIQPNWAPKTLPPKDIF